MEKLKLVLHLSTMITSLTLVSFILCPLEKKDKLYTPCMFNTSIALIVLFITTFLITVATEKKCGTETVVFLLLNFLGIIISCIICDVYSIYYELNDSGASISEKDSVLKINETIIIMCWVQVICCVISLGLLGFDGWCFYNGKNIKNYPTAILADKDDKYDADGKIV